MTRPRSRHSTGTGAWSTGPQVDRLIADGFNLAPRAVNRSSGAKAYSWASSFEHLGSVMHEHRVPAPNLNLSGFSWQCYRGSAGPALARSIASVLRPGGSFTQFTYAWTRWTPPVRRQRNVLQLAFERIEVSGTVWRNAPPAFLYTYRTGSGPSTCSA